MNDIEYILLIVLLFLIAVCMFSYTMNAPVIEEEQLYVSTGVSVVSHTIYTDVVYPHTPYLPLIYAGVYKITGTEYYLLYARLFTFLTILASIVVMYMLGYMITNNFFVSLLAVLMYSFSGVTLHALGYAWNVAPPVVFSLLGVYFFLKVSYGGGVRPLHVFLAGLFIAIAGGIKLYYFAIAVPLIISSLIFPLSYSIFNKIRYSFAPLLAGLIIGLLPALIYYLRDPQLFLINNLELHALQFEWHYENNLLAITGIAAVFSTVRYIAQTVGWQTLVAVGFAAAAGIGLLFLNYKSAGEVYSRYFTNKKPFVLCMILLVTVILAFKPSVFWQHPLAYPFPFLVLFIISIYPALTDRFKKYFVSVFGMAVLFVCIYGIPPTVQHIDEVTSSAGWTPVAYHREAKAITGVVPGTDRIVTVEPLVALEGGRTIYPEFSTGQFAFRVGENLSTGQMPGLRSVSTESLSRWLEIEQPQAVIIPEDSKYYVLFEASIPANGYHKTEDQNGGYSIYIRY